MTSPQKRLCWHWTAGGPKANQTDKKHYHYLVEQDGAVVPGRWRPEDNFRVLSNRDDRYAAHCGGGNSYTIGLALCGMHRPRRGGAFSFPLTRAQFERACLVSARLCLKFDIPVTPVTVYTHYEFGLRNPGTDSAGKIDLNQLPFEPKLKPEDVGEYIRDKIRWYMHREQRK